MGKAVLARAASSGPTSPWTAKEPQSFVLWGFTGCRRTSAILQK